MNRSFTAEKWTNFLPRKGWYEAVDEAFDLVDDQIETDIQGYDIDGEIIRAARQNAEAAGVDHLIHFQQRPVSELSHPKKYGSLSVTRLMENVWKKRKHCRDCTARLESGSAHWTAGLCI